MKAHPRAELDQSRCLGRYRGVRSDPEVLGDAQQQGQVTHRLSRGREQQPLRRIGKRPDASQEALFDLACQRPRVGADEPACQFGRGQPSRQLQQGEGVTAGFCDDPIFDALVDAAGHGRFQ